MIRKTGYIENQAVWIYITPNISKIPSEKFMRILVACEYSGVVRDAFIRKGHYALSCDLDPSESSFGEHYLGPVQDIISMRWDMLIAFPPCTALSSAGRWYWKNRPAETEAAVDFFKSLWYSGIEKICIENPQGIMSKRLQRPNQVIHPYYFGDSDMKRTCLWLKNLSRLNGLTAVAMNPGLYKPAPAFRDGPETKNPGKARYFVDTQSTGKKKAKTFFTIAQAMANQWG